MTDLIKNVYGFASAHFIYFIIYGMAVNLTAFAMYGMDKSKAKCGKWRIPESTLIGVAALGGAFGAWLGMKVFHHKTRHLKFNLLVPAFCVIWTALIICLLVFGR